MVAAVTNTQLAVSDRLSTAVSDLEPDSAKALRSAFETMFAQAEHWEERAKSIKVTSIDQKHEMKFARESRLALRSIRIEAEKTRKRLKEDSVRRGKAIDGIANVLKALIEPIEEYLQVQEDFGEREEAKRKDALRTTREQALRAYGVDPAVYANLGETDDATWETTLDNARVAHEARLEAARKAEEIRLEAERIAAERREAERAAAVKAEAERAERERIQAEENARLKKEAADREAAAKIEREKVAAERAELEAKAKAEREAAEQEKARIEAEARKAREEAEKAERALAAEREAAARAQRDREETEARAKAEREAAEAARVAAEEAQRQAAALAPDREKLLAFAASLRELDIPSLSTDKGKAAGEKVASQMAKMVAWVEKTAGSL